MQFVKDVIIEGRPQKAYIDGGSHNSAIARTLANEMGGIQRCVPIFLKGFGAQPMMCDEKMVPKIEVDGKLYCGDVYVVEDADLLPDQLLLGTDLLCSVGRYVLIGDNKYTMIRSITDCAPELSQLLSSYKECFSDNIKEIGTATTTSMRIELTTTTPVCLPALRIPFAKRDVV